MYSLYKKILTLFCLILFTFSLCSHAQNASSGLDIRVSGADDGINIILIPGLSSPGAVWNSTVDALSDKYRFHIFTLPGFAGTSPVSTKKPFIEAMADEIVEYILQNKLEKPILAGHSLGGFLSLYIGANHPNLPAKIISVDGVPFLPAMTNPYMTEESAVTLAENMKNQLLQMSDNQRLAQQKQVIATMVTDPEKQKTAVEWSMQSDVETVADAVHYLYSSDLRDDLSRIEVPVLVFGAWKAYENYGVTKQMSLEMYRRQFSELDDVTIEISENGKHFLMWDDPELITSKFDKFLSN
jgi:pimeloyl-ACP methyl ester carboxylesterase